MKYIQPTVFATSYTCPHCGAIAKQDWWYKRWQGDVPAGIAKETCPLRIGTCQHCSKRTVWVEEKMYFLN